MKFMQKFPVRHDVKRAREGDVQNYPDTRKDPIKRMKLERVIDFLTSNKDIYQSYIDYKIKPDMKNEKKAS